MKPRPLTRMEQEKLRDPLVRPGETTPIRRLTLEEKLEGAKNLDIRKKTSALFGPKKKWAEEKFREWDRKKHFGIIDKEPKRPLKALCGYCKYDDGKALPNMAFPVCDICAHFARTYETMKRRKEAKEPPEKMKLSKLGYILKHRRRKEGEKYIPGQSQLYPEDELLLDIEDETD